MQRVSYPGGPWCEVHPDRASHSYNTQHTALLKPIISHIPTVTFRACHCLVPLVLASIWKTCQHLWPSSLATAQAPHHQQLTTNRLASKLRWSHLNKIVAAAIRRHRPPLPSRDLDFKTWSCPSVEVLFVRRGPKTKIGMWTDKQTDRRLL